MPAYDDMLTLAQICAKNAHTAGNRAVAQELWEMAKEYREKAMALDSTAPIDLGPPPAGLSD